MEHTFHLASFRTSTETMAAEARLRQEGIGAAVMPMPQEIQASCGLCLRFSPEVSPEARQLISEEVGKNRCRFYEAVREDGHMHYALL